MALKRLRLKAGFSQEQLAERARLSAESIGALERGARRAPYRETVELLAGALGASEAELDELRATARRPRRLPGAPGNEPAGVPPAAPRAPNNLPYEATSLRGRERDLANVRALIEQQRIVTVAGAGGIGKTRLAVALAGGMLGEAGFDGVWFVDLAPIASSDLVATAIAKVMGVAQTSGLPFEATLVSEIAHKRGLIVLDNCEHVLEKAADLAAAIRTSCPGVRIVATSRQALGLSGEAVYRLPSLDVPAVTEGLSADEARRYGAIALFVDRANVVDSEFVLDDRNAPLVASVCAQLDGIALAIELAAARVNVLSVAGLAKRLTERFRLLTGGNPRALRRQRTLSALIDWSYDLLEPAERRMLNRVAIFSGGFGLEAASAVCAEEGQDQYDVLDLLASLVDKSLLSADTTRETERYGLLESTRAYALERLDAFGERAGVAGRHAAYFAQLASEADANYGKVKTSVWLPPLEAETGNFRRALEWSLGGGNDAVTGGVLAGALERYWLNAGLEAEGRRWIELALERISEHEQPGPVARLQRALAWIATGETKCAAAAKAAELYAGQGNALGQGDSLRLLALGQAQVGRMDEAAGTNARALGIFRALGDRRNLANCLDLGGAIASQLGQFESARASLEEALELFRDLGSEGGSASVLTSLAQLEFLCGNPERALELTRRGQAIRGTSRYSTNVAIDHVLMALCCIALGRLDDARVHAATAVEAARHAQNDAVATTALLAWGAVASLRGDAELGARLLGFTDVTLKRLGIDRDLVEQRIHHELVTAVRAKLSEPRIESLAAEGALWSAERALSEVEATAESA